MTNRICRIDVSDHRLDPALAEVRLVVSPERIDAATTVRARLLGPRCQYSTTVEIVYHFQPIPETASDAITLRALIPEPSLWEPECPFLYEGPVELWQDGTRVDAWNISHGLRTVTLGPKGLRVNGRPLLLRGWDVSQELARRPASDGSIPPPALGEGVRGRGYRSNTSPPQPSPKAGGANESGCNLLIIPDDAFEQTCHDADRFGCFLLTRQRQGVDTPRSSSHLGWLLAPGESRPADLPAGALVGAELDDTHPTPPTGVDFVVAPPHLAVAATLPCLVLGEGPTPIPLGTITPP
jgi:hypothetical protein